MVYNGLGGWIHGNVLFSSVLLSSLGQSGLVMALSIESSDIRGPHTVGAPTINGGSLAKGVRSLTTVAIYAVSGSKEHRSAKIPGPFRAVSDSGGKGGNHLERGVALYLI